MTWNLKIKKKDELNLLPEQGLITDAGGLLAAELSSHSLCGHNYNVALKLSEHEVGYGKLQFICTFFIARHVPICQASNKLLNI
jgi:hypothetical protein